MSINFEVSEHLFLEGLHLKTEFENGYEVSIVPSQFNSERVEIGIFYEGTMISTFRDRDEDLLCLTMSRALQICRELKALNPNI
tara:strand:- start:1973 stop:2224 length:252 start_codon:yes stop_codon:yes gene_type:complete